jgi:aarF domain-containing kinase
MSVRDDFVPPVYLEWLKELQDEVPMTISSEDAQALVAEELHLGEAGLSSVLYDWQDEPIGTASIGQVYKARLTKTGEWIAVKVQVPNAERLFRADIKTLQMFTYFALPWAYQNMVEIEKAFRAEFDYVAEFRNLTAIHDNIMPTWRKKVHVPKVIPEVVSRRVLGMELLDGDKFVSAVQCRLKPLADRKGVTVEQYSEEFLADLRTGKRKPESVKLLRWKLRFQRWFAWFSWIIRGCRGKLELPVDIASAFETLMALHGQQVLQDGCFNADPHPGNLMLLKDGRTLGLIDFGQVIRVPLEFRLKLARLIIALAKRNRADVARLEAEMGVERKYSKEDVRYRMCSFWLDRDTDDVTQGLNLFDFLLWGEENDPVLSQTDGYYMACRCSVTLRSAALAFGVRISTAEYWRPYAEALLRKHGQLNH